MNAHSNSGFTLIELMVVVIVLAALAGMIVPRLIDKPDEMKNDIAKMDMRSIDTVLKTYHLKHSEYPKSLDMVSGEFDMALNDPWGRPYKYKYPGSGGEGRYDLYSVGPDGQEGTGDDVKPGS